MPEKIVAAYPGYTVVSVLPEDAKALPKGADLGHAVKREPVIAWRISDADEAWPITAGAVHQHPDAIWGVIDPEGGVVMRDHDVFRDRESFWKYVATLIV